MCVMAPPPPPRPPPPPIKAEIKPAARLIQSGRLMQPRAIPKDVAVFKEADLPPDVAANNNGTQGGVFGGIPGQGIMAGGKPPHAPPPPTKPLRASDARDAAAAPRHPHI